MQEKANELARQYLLNEENKTIYVTFPDQAVYLNSDLERIKEHCEDHKLTVVVVKGEEVKPEPKQEQKEESTKPKGKK